MANLVKSKKYTIPEYKMVVFIYETKLHVGSADAPQIGPPITMPGKTYHKDFPPSSLIEIEISQEDADLFKVLLQTQEKAQLEAKKYF